MKQFELKKYYTEKELAVFANYMIDISRRIGMKISSRGWCYILEGNRLINKNQFDKVEELINNCRRKGFLPIDFVAEEKAREFEGIEVPHDRNVVEMLGAYLHGALNVPNHYTPDWWDGEKYYIQMVVEKVDIVTLFEPVCRKYHIPIANSKGWSSMLQRAEYSRRFAEAEERGMQCVILYYGDFDCDGFRISDFIHKNLDDLKNITWSDGMNGYDPENLIIDRFGLEHDFIKDNNLTWIDNLITGGNKDLASPTHKNHKLPYVQEYIKKYGARKCEANAVLVIPDIVRQSCQEAIEKYLGDDSRDRFQAKRQAVVDEFNNFMDNSQFDVEVEKIGTGKNAKYVSNLTFAKAFEEIFNTIEKY